tara:strand:- start:811 stop:1143 length:333 start_codon:yes stop_codon:yes gene_type:complete
MDAEQKYTEANSYDVGQEFIDKLKQVPLSVSLSVARLIDECFPRIPFDEMDSQIHGGVVHNKEEAIFFSIEIFNSETESPYLMDFNLIDSDEYLDLILEKKYLKSNDRTN